MKPVRMTGVRIIGLKKNLQSLIESLHKIGLLHLKSSEYANLSESSYMERHAQVSKYLVMARALLSALPSYESRVPKEKYTLELALDKGKILEQIEPDVRDTTEAIAAVNEELAKLVEQYARLKPYQGFAFDLARVQGSHLLEAKLFIAKKPELLYGALARHEGYVESLALPNGAILAIMKKGIALELPEGVQETALPDGVANVSEELARLEQRREELLGKLNGLHGILSDYSLKYYPLLLQVEEELSIWLTRSETMQSTKGTGNFFVVEGYVPVKRLDEFRGLLANGPSVLVEETGAGHDMPTQLDNPAPAVPFQNFIEFLSLPQYHELDPSLIVLFTLPIIYGLIVGDAGYGLISLAIAFLMGRGSKGLLKTITSIWMISALPTMIFGVLFDEYFGLSHVHLLEFLGVPVSGPLYLGLHRVTELSTLILITIIVGLMHIGLGFLLGIINEYGHSKKHALAKLCWLAIEVSGTLLVAALLFNTATQLLPIAGLVFVGAAAGLVATEGFVAVFEIPGLASNVMSYLRIAAVGVGGVILAEAINEMFLPKSRDPVMFAITAVMFAILHVFNTFIAMFEAFIHGARLNVLEFFMKFYKGNGQAYSPFRAETKYVEE